MRAEFKYEYTDADFRDLYEREAELKAKHARMRKDHFYNVRDDHDRFGGWYRTPESHYEDLAGSKKWDFLDDEGRWWHFDCVKDNGETFTAYDRNGPFRKGTRTFAWDDLQDFE